MTLSTQLAWFASELQGEGLTVVLGRPSWARPTVAPPVCAVSCEGLEPPDASARSIGRANQPLTGIWAITLYGRDEPDMLAMVETVRAWAETAGSAVIDSVRYPLALVGGERLQSETGTQQEAYAFELRYGLRA